MTKDEALKLALEALDCIYSPLHVREINKVGDAMKAIREALAQPEQLANHIGEANKMVEQPAKQQKPYGYVSLEDGNKFQFDKPEIGIWNPVYTTPPHRKPLSDEEMFKIAEIAWRHGWASCRDAEYVGEEAEDEQWGMVGAEVVQDIAAHGIKEEA